MQNCSKMLMAILAPITLLAGGLCDECFGLRTKELNLEKTTKLGKKSKKIKKKNLKVMQGYSNKNKATKDTPGNFTAKEDDSPNDKKEFVSQQVKTIKKTKRINESKLHDKTIKEPQNSSKNNTDIIKEILLEVFKNFFRLEGIEKLFENFSCDLENTKKLKLIDKNFFSQNAYNIIIWKLRNKKTSDNDILKDLTIKDFCKKMSSNELDFGNDLIEIYTSTWLQCCKRIIHFVKLCYQQFGTKFLKQQEKLDKSDLKPSIYEFVYNNNKDICNFFSLLSKKTSLYQDLCSFTFFEIRSIQQALGNIDIIANTEKIDEKDKKMNIFDKLFTKKEKGSFCRLKEDINIGKENLEKLFCNLYKIYSIERTHISNKNIKNRKNSSNQNTVEYHIFNFFYNKVEIPGYEDISTFGDLLEKKYGSESSNNTAKGINIKDIKFYFTDGVENTFLQIK